VLQRELVAVSLHVLMVELVVYQQAVEQMVQLNVVWIVPHFVRADDSSKWCQIQRPALLR
jgi:hypothetical protein